MATITIPVVPELPDAARLQREFDRMSRSLKLDFGKIAKVSSIVDMNELKGIVNAVDAISDRLDQGAKNALKEYKNYIKQYDTKRKELSELHEKMEKHAEGTAEHTEAKKAYEEVEKAIFDLRLQVDKSFNGFKKHNQIMAKTSKLEEKRRKRLVSEMSGKAGAMGRDAIIPGIRSSFDAMGGDLSSGLSSLGKSIGSLIAGKIARGQMERYEKAEEAGDQKGMTAAVDSMAKLETASIALGASVAVFAGLFMLIKKASEAMTGFNKEILKGVGFARDMGAGGAKYKESLDSLRNAVIDNAIEFGNMGVKQEEAFQMINTFTHSASGSIVQTTIALNELSDMTSVNAGVKEFVKQSKMYANALGMESTEITKTMGDLVSGLGYNHKLAMGVMGDVVKQASQSNLPLDKFVDIFRDAVPNLDLFTNRIETVTGMVKLMSKTMDPRRVKGFIDAMSRSFSERGFRDRLKIRLITGEKGEKALRDDIGVHKESVSQALSADQREGFEQAFKSGKLKEFAAKGALSGAIPPALIDSINRLSRFKELAESKSIPDQATAMKDMSAFGRIKTLDALSTRLTPGYKYLAGIAEHVADQLGISKDEAQMLIDLRASLDTHMISITENGHTSSKSINDGLMKIYGEQGKTFKTFGEFEAFMKTEATTNSEKLRDNILKASTVQIENEKRLADEAAKQEASLEEMTHALVNATLSVSDILENIIAALLSKLFAVVDKGMSFIRTALSWLTGSDADQATIKTLKSWSDKSEQYGLKGAQKTYYQEQSAALIEDVSSLGSEDLMKKYGKDVSGYEGSAADIFKSIGVDKTRSDQILDTLKRRKETAAQQGMELDPTTELLGALSKDELAKYISEVKFRKAKELSPEDLPGPTKKGIKYDREYKGAYLANKARAQVDTDLEKRGSNVLVDAGFAPAEPGTPMVASTPGGTSPVVRNTPSSMVDDAARQQAGVEQLLALENMKISPTASTGGGAGAPAESSGAPARSAETTAENTDIIAVATDSSQAILLKTFNLLNTKGIKLEKSFLTTSYKDTVSDAVEIGVRRPLLEQTILYAKMWDDEEFRKELAGSGAEILSGGFTMEEIIGIDKADGTWFDAFRNAGIPAKLEEAAGGGYISSDGLLSVHAGEYIGTPQRLGEMGALAGGISKTVTIGTVVINSTTDASPEAIAAAIYNMANKH